MFIIGYNTRIWSRWLCCKFPTFTDAFFSPTFCLSLLSITSVDPAFERYMPGNLALVFEDGFVEWLTPAVLTSSCRVHVKFFPFDTQVCEMKMASWSYTDKQIHMKAETGRLAKQDR